MLKVESIKHLDELLENGCEDFFIHLGIARSSKNIQKEDNIYIIFHEIDGACEEITREELLKTNINIAITNNRLYCTDLN